MKALSLFFKKLKDKVGFRVMTKEEYATFLKEKGIHDNSVFESDSITNPATGLPMVGGVDIGGNPYGSGGRD